MFKFSAQMIPSYGLSPEPIFLSCKMDSFGAIPCRSSILFPDRQYRFDPRRGFPIVNLIDPQQLRSRLEQLGDATGGGNAYPRNPEGISQRAE